MPRPNRLVATKIRRWKSLNCWYRDNLAGVEKQQHHELQNWIRLYPKLRVNSQLGLVLACLLQVLTLSTSIWAWEKKTYTMRTVSRDNNKKYDKLKKRKTLFFLKWRSTNLSSCAMPLWMAIAGKFCSTSSWDRATQRATDFTKITTCEEYKRNCWVLHIFRFVLEKADMGGFKRGQDTQVILENKFKKIKKG